MSKSCGCNARHQVGTRASVDNSDWDGPAAMSACANGDDPASCYEAICAGRKSGDADKQESWALPHHKHAGDPPNAAGVKNALSRLPQTDGLTNKQAAEDHLNAHMKAISPDDDEKNSAERLGFPRATDHTHPTPDGSTLTHAHSSHDAEAGHAHHADSQWGQTGPMASNDDDDPDDEEDDNEEPGDFDSPEDFMDPSVDHEDSGVSTEFNSAPPRSNLVRARIGAGVGLRAVADGQPPSILFGIFSRYNEWYEVSSRWEGHFLERVAPGAFKQTIAEDAGSMRCLFDHGMDPNLGYKPLGPIRTLEDRSDGPYYEVPLLDTDYNRNFVLPALTGTLMDGTQAGSQLGASFRFEVREEQWNTKPKISTRNPTGIPERTITNSRVFEFGPVTFPANPTATAGARSSVRSLSDVFMSRLATDPRFFAEFEARVGRQKARKVLDTVPETLRHAPADAPRSNARWAQLQRRARALLVVRSA